MVHPNNIELSQTMGFGICFDCNTVSCYYVYITYKIFGQFISLMHDTRTREYYTHTSPKVSPKSLQPSA